MVSYAPAGIDLSRINSDIVPGTPDVFDLGTLNSGFRSAHIALDLTLGRNLLVRGSLNVEGPITTIESQTLVVADKNIELASSPSPTDALADGGGITLRGTTDKTMLWRNATDSWNFNRAIQTGNLRFDGNTISSFDTNGDIVLDPNGSGNLVVKSQIQIEGGNPATGRVLTGLDGNGLADWQLPSGNGWVDDGTVVRLGTSTDDVVIGANTGFGAKLDVRDPGGVSVGGFPSGALHVTSDSSAQFANAVITGHNLFGGNTQLWYLGSVSGSNDDVRFFNRQAGNLFLGTNNTTFFTMNAVGNITVGPLTATQLTADNLRLDGNVFSSIDTDGIIIIDPNGTGALLLTTDKVLMLGSSPAATGDNSGLVEIRDNRTTTGANPNYVLSINQQNGTLSVLSMGNDGNGDAILVTNNNDLRIGNDVAGTFTENVRFMSDGKTGFGTPSPDVTSLLELSSTTLGFLPPRMTSTQVAAIPTPATGLIVYDTVIDKLKLATPTAFQNLLSEDIGQVLIQETFASSNVRFFGELALPAAQGWTDTATGPATIDLVTQTVFGEVKQVVRHNDDSSGSTTSDIVLTAQNWTDINAFGASYGGTSRLDSAIGGFGFFSGLQANSAENPLATGNRRYGIQFNNNAGNLRLTESDNTGNNVTMDGTGGNPLITFDEWFSWECVVPAGLGAAQFYINGILTTFVPVFGVNGGGLGTAIKVGSGSSGGTLRVAYHDNFGVTIYEEAATRTLAAATMAGDVAQINIPEGKRDYVIILPDGNPRNIGAVLRMVVSNLLGKITLENQNPAAPEILYNGLRTFVINIAVKETIEGINTVSSGNVYLGFEIATLHVGGKFIDTTDQIIVVADTPQVITFNINKIIDGVSHTVGSSVFNINTSGKYKLEVAPQVFQGSGAAKVEFWLRRNGTDIVNSGVQFDIGANSQALPLLLWKEEVIAGDTIECVWASDSANTKLDNLTSLFGGPNIPSIMFRVTLVAI